MPQQFHDSMSQRRDGIDDYLAETGLLWARRDFEDLRLLDAAGMPDTHMELLAVSELAKWCSVEKTAPELRCWTKAVRERAAVDRTPVVMRGPWMRAQRALCAATKDWGW
ncbi:MAG: hypothetical protein EXR71_07875 [Myxococcales bacterium]|nr:hypothetical protein [Myxococcales bacterium]